MIQPGKPLRTLITPAIMTAMLGYGILLALFFNLPLTGLDYPSGTPAFLLLDLLANLREGIERPQLVLKIMALSCLLIGSVVCLGCYLNKERMNLLRLIFAGVAFAGTCCCGLGREAYWLFIVAGICFALCAYGWKACRPAGESTPHLFRHAFPVMMRHPECLLLSTGLLLLVLTQTIGQVFAEEGDIGLYVAYPFLLLGRLMFLYALWASGKKYKSYRLTFMLAGLSSLISILDILGTRYLGIHCLAQWPRLSLHSVYLACDVTALAFMWSKTLRKAGRVAIALIATYVVIAYLLGFILFRATLGLQLPILVYCNLIVILGWMLFITDLYRRPPAQNARISLNRRIRKPKPDPE